ncbi:MAG TPA: MFS transporter, partial [Acidimicrobiales bacterium]|nr:MFS transporter [Acidimicrobiales bacterium]
AALVVAISQGDQLGWVSPPVVACLLLAAALGTAFVGRERRHPAPMVDVRLFLRRPFAAGVASTLLAFVVLFGVLVVVPYYFERSLGAGTVRTGLELMAMPLALGVVAPMAGRVADRIGVRMLSGAGMVIAAAALLWLSAARPSQGAFAGLLAMLGVGLGLFNAPNNAGIMASVPPSQSGLASGLMNMSRGLGTALGLAVTTSVFVAAGGGSHLAGPVAHAFSVSCAVLAVVALAAAVIAGTGDTPEAPLPRRPAPVPSTAGRSAARPGSTAGTAGAAGTGAGRSP